MNRSSEASAACLTTPSQRLSMHSRHMVPPGYTCLVRCSAMNARSPAAQAVWRCRQLCPGCTLYGNNICPNRHSVVNSIDTCRMVAQFIRTVQHKPTYTSRGLCFAAVQQTACDRLANINCTCSTLIAIYYPYQRASAAKMTSVCLYY